MMRIELAKVHQSQWRWHFAKGQTQESVHHSDRHLFEDDDGHWRQESLPFNPGLTQSHPHWHQHVRLWNRRLRVTAATDLQLNLLRKHIFLFSPKVQALPTLDEWTISWTLPNRSLGPLLGSMCFRQALPPTRFLMTYFETLSQVPVLPLSHRQETPIYFNGWLLLHFLANALPHLEKRDPPNGTWHSSRHGNGTSLLPTDLDPDGPHLANPLLPQSLRFLPHLTRQVPAAHLKALHYDSDRQILTCSQRVGLDLQFHKFQLPQPLYKFFGTFQFTDQSRAMVLRKVLTFFPDALLPTESIFDTPPGEPPS